MNIRAHNPLSKISRQKKVFLLRTIVVLSILGLSFLFYRVVFAPDNNSVRVKTETTLQTEVEQHKLALSGLFYVDGSNPDSDYSTAQVWSFIDSTRAQLEESLNRDTPEGDKPPAHIQKIRSLLNKESTLFETYKSEYRSLGKIMQYILSADINKIDSSEKETNITKLQMAVDGIEQTASSAILSSNTRSGVDSVTLCLSDLKDLIASEDTSKTDAQILTCEKEYSKLRQAVLGDINNSDNSNGIKRLIDEFQSISI